MPGETMMWEKRESEGFGHKNENADSHLKMELTSSEELKKEYLRLKERYETLAEKIKGNLTEDAYTELVKIHAGIDETMESILMKFRDAEQAKKQEAIDAKAALN